jgi:hypothetical protein
MLQHQALLGGTSHSWLVRFAPCGECGLAIPRTIPNISIPNDDRTSGAEFNDHDIAVKLLCVSSAYHIGVAETNSNGRQRRNRAEKIHEESPKSNRWRDADSPDEQLWLIKTFCSCLGCFPAQGFMHCSRLAFWRIYFRLLFFCADRRSGCGVACWVDPACNVVRLRQLPRNNDASRPVAGWLESCFLPEPAGQSTDLGACPLRALGACGLHDSSAHTRPSVA